MLAWKQSGVNYSEETEGKMGKTLLYRAMRIYDGLLRGTMEEMEHFVPEE